MQSMELHLEGESLTLKLLCFEVLDALYVYVYKDGKPYWNLGEIKDGMRMMNKTKRN